MPAPQPTTFVATNAAIHATLHEHHWRLIEALTELDLVMAQNAFAALTSLLHAHLDVEEHALMPAFLEFVPHSDGEKTLKLVDGDHIILQRSEDAMAAQLAAFGHEVSRRTMVLTIETFLRFGRVLEHHTSREEKTLYPAFDAARAEGAPGVEALLERLAAVL